VRSHNKVDKIHGKGEIITKPVAKPRKGWEQAFKEMAEHGDDALLFDDVFIDENIEE
jgi:antitoxin MazE